MGRQCGVFGEQSKEGPKGRSGWRLVEGPKLGRPWRGHGTLPTPWTGPAGDGIQPPGAREVWVRPGKCKKVSVTGGKSAKRELEEAVHLRIV